METRIILITSSTDGIGNQAAIELAKMDHHVIVHGRNREMGEKTMEIIQRVSLLF